MSTQMAVVNDTPETKEQKRKRLADELRYISEQWNSKLLEICDEGMTVVITMPSMPNRIHKLTMRNERAVIEDCRISFQTAPKTY